MKQTYTKPTLRVERFTIAQSIATSCGWVSGRTEGFPTQADKSACGWNDGWGDVYWVTAPVCTTPTSEDAIVGEVCYNNPNGNFSVFAS